jgi:hypothetical protein
MEYCTHSSNFCRLTVLFSDLHGLLPTYNELCRLTVLFSDLRSLLLTYLGQIDVSFGGADNGARICEGVTDPGPKFEFDATKPHNPGRPKSQQSWDSFCGVPFCVLTKVNEEVASPPINWSAALFV